MTSVNETVTKVTKGKFQMSFSDFRAAMIHEHPTALSDDTIHEAYMGYKVLVKPQADLEATKAYIRGEGPRPEGMLPLAPQPGAYDIIAKAHPEAREPGGRPEWVESAFERAERKVQTPVWTPPTDPESDPARNEIGGITRPSWIAKAREIVKILRA